MKINSEWWHKDDVINALNERDQEIESIKKQLDEAVKVIEFYEFGLRSKMQFDNGNLAREFLQKMKVDEI